MAGVQYTYVVGMTRGKAKGTVLARVKLAFDASDRVREKKGWPWFINEVKRVLPEVQLVEVPVTASQYVEFILKGEEASALLADVKANEKAYKDKIIREVEALVLSLY